MNKLSTEMNHALTQNDTKAIWAAVASQETLAREFEGVDKTAKDEPTGRRQITDLISEIRQTQYRNQAMAQTFLDLIDITFKSLTQQQGKGNPTYRADGNKESCMAPILIHQTG